MASGVPAPSLREPSGVNLQSLDGPEGNGVDGGYGLVTEVTEVFGKGTEVAEGIRRIWKYAEVTDKGTEIMEPYQICSKVQCKRI